MNRREILKNLGALAVASPAAGALAAADPAVAGGTSKKLKVVVTGGHPGDPEYGCGGTIARFADRGDDVVLLYMNDGAWPPTDAATRLAEAKKACEILGARPAYVGQTNGHSVVDNAHYERFRAILAAEKPDVVFSQWPIDHHPDHRALTSLVMDAWLHDHQEFALYYYEVGQDTMMFRPCSFVNITAMEARKKTACYAHASQTPDYWYPLQIQLAEFRGVEGGFPQAEGFLRHWQSASIALP
jgi:LmbE family N-acetylglucosaminyl deacetylase